MRQLVPVLILCLVLASCDRHPTPTAQPMPTPLPTATPAANNVPLPTNTAVPTSPPKPTSTPKAIDPRIYVGMPADDVLDLLGKGSESRVIGKDAEGLIVEWIYPGAIYTMKLRDGRYRVAAVRPR